MDVVVDTQYSVLSLGCPVFRNPILNFDLIKS